MENPTLRFRIKKEIGRLISKSCADSQSTEKFEPLHIAILKKYYNAADVSIDHHRKRVVMDIVMDDRNYDPNKVNTYIPLLHANLLFRNLKDFLMSCIDMKAENLGFYAGLIRTFTKQEMGTTVVQYY